MLPLLTRRGHRLLVLAAVTAVLVACGDGGGGGEPRRARAFERNVGRWALPLDDYHPDSLVAELRGSHAESLLVAECLEPRGVIFPAGDPPTEEARAAAENLQGRRLFDEEIAATLGYRTGTVMERSVGRPAEEAEFAEALAADPSLQEVFDSCLDEARAELPLLDIDLIESLESSAYEAAKVAPEVETAAARWRECLEPLGIADIPDRPDDMPPTAQAEQFGLLEGDGEGPATEPSAAEIELAVADATCRASSGVSEALYDAEVDAQLASIDDNEAALDRLRDSVEDHTRQVEAVIEEHS